MGLAARLAFSLSISAPGELQRYRLRLTGAKVILEVPPRRNAVASDPVMKRLGVLAAAFDRKGEILVG
jgi:exopolyphosphatase/guanosine-5'-triphosphate,3'-diphosphate pyrophosphatase